ncbi:MAG: hypothetical protein WD749_01065 [Phycisphaerales bacterium]
MEGRRALTMIETLATVAILAAVAALAFPALSAWLAPARQDAALAQIAAAVGAGRAEARRTGRAIEVAARPLGDATEIVLRPLGGDPDARADDRAARNTPVRHIAMLRDGFTIGAAETSTSPHDDPGADRAAEGTVIALCLPDGLVEGRSGVRVRRGEVELELTVSRWSGEVVASPAEDGEDALPEDEAPPEAPAPAEPASAAPPATGAAP